jgi:anion transporter
MHTPTDPLDMQQYRVEKLPKRQKSSIEKWIAQAGLPLAATAFITLGFLVDLPFLDHIEASQVTAKSARVVLENIGIENFIRNNHLMFGLFIAAIILWVTEAIPNYLTSLVLIVSLVLAGVLPEKEAYAQLGHPVMWLNIMSFVLASMLVATGVAKRLALWFILRFGKNASSIFFSFIIINLILSAFISATTAKAAILLPIFMVIASIYGAQSGSGKNNFGRSIVLQNLLNINLGAGAFATGSGANLLAIALIAGATSSTVFFADWLTAMLPVMIILMLLGYILAMKVFFPLKPDERLPQIEGGMAKLKQEYDKLGKLSTNEIKSIIIFLLILAFWSTDKLHGISATAVAFVGAIVALFPGIGVVKWNDVDIPWHLMLFSAGAYALGAGFDATDLPSLMVNAFFDHLGIGNNTPFWLIYVLLTGVMTFSALLFQSKTMRTMIFVPIAIGIANRFGFEVLSLALPVAFMIEHVYVLPFNSKPAALLYETDMYSYSDAFRFGFSMMISSWILIIIAGQTWFKLLGITPHGVFF